VPPGDLDALCARVLALGGDESLLEVGPGPGHFLGYLRRHGARGRLVGLDRSETMVREARDAYPDADWVPGSVEELPFADGTFDAAAARHMLYHVGDIDRAVAELARVAGRLLVTTNGAEYLPRNDELLSRCLAAFGLPPAERTALRFAAEDAGAVLGRHFGSVTEHWIRSELVFAAPGPIAAYAASCLGLRGVDPDPDLRSRMHAWLVDEAARQLRDVGTWRDPKPAIVVLAS
jgi:SAM-dependent methyltransferase